MPEAVRQSAEFLQEKGVIGAQIGMITGTGLSTLTESMGGALRIPYSRVPHFPQSTVAGHRGTLAFGEVAGRGLLALEGRFHLYEGYSPAEIAFPVRVMAALGVRHLLVSSAAGGLNPLFRPGDLMLVTDHINLTGRNPLMGPNPEDLGPRFPDMSQAYGKEGQELARRKALELGLLLREGVYAGLTGPSLETPSETRFLRLVGGDAVGMSTVTEVIAAVHVGLKVTAIVVITNVNLPDCMREISLEEVIRTAEQAGKRLGVLWERIIGELP